MFRLRTTASFLVHQGHDVHDFYQDWRWEEVNHGIGWSHFLSMGNPHVVVFCATRRRMFEEDAISVKSYMEDKPEMIRFTSSALARVCRGGGGGGVEKATTIRIHANRFDVRLNDSLSSNKCSSKIEKIKA